MRVFRFLRQIVWLPVLLTRLVERGVQLAAGEDWYRAGLRIITLFLGDAGLWLWRRPVSSPPARVIVRLLGWTLCLSWFPILVGLLMQLPTWRVLVLVPWLLLLFIFLRQGKRLRRAADEPDEPAWPKRPLSVRLTHLDYLSLAIIAALAIFLWCMRGYFLAFPPDSYYHLSVARYILENGRIPLWDTWSYAPEGRPHLYPPLFHLLIVLCALPYGGDALKGFNVMQATLSPFSLLCTWYAARWLFNEKRAFLALLIVGADLSTVVFNMMCTPSALVNAFMLLLLVCFLSKRFVLSTILVTLGLYTHMGVTPFFLLGLLLFAFWQREYLTIWLTMTALSLILVLPWYAHVWENRQWFGNPVDTEILKNAGPFARFLFKLGWMQSINVIMVLLVIRAWGYTKWSEKRNGLLLAIVIAFIPMLFSYGARYFIHTAPLWSMLIAVLFVPFLSDRFSWRRIALLGALAVFCPALVITGVDSRGIGPGPLVSVSGWLMASTAVSGLGITAVDRARMDMGEVGVREAQEAGRYIRTVTDKDTVLYVDDDRDTALMLGYFAHRPIDSGAWPEVEPKDYDGAAKRRAALHEGTGFHVTRADHPPPSHLAWWRHGAFLFGAAQQPPGETEVDSK